MSTPKNSSLYNDLVKAISYAAAMIILLWLLYKTSGAILLLLFALILAVVINAPIALLEKKGLKRFLACLIVFFIIIVVFGLLGWLIIPRISDQITMLINNLPGYADHLSKNVASWFKDYPEISKDIQEQGVSLSEWAPSVPRTLMSIGNYSLSILGTVLIIIFFISMVVYTVTNPRPLLQLFFSFFPADKHEKTTIALQNASTMIIGWMKSNIIGGTIKAVCITIFLSIMGIPGALVWGAFAFFSDLIPRIGFYLMSIPPILVALSINPTTALWVTIFMLALDEIMGDFVLPKIRSNTMKIHPVSIIFVLLAMGAAFGVMGALLATPLTAIIKAFYEAFFIDRFTEDKQLDDRIDAILYNPGDAKAAVPEQLKNG
ncbi:MAG TPA: AI-2E family transporter [Flavisolibacter sp.]|jgi:predicted PurR-regulated permease PerM|nr:AI-2E family transporter [Flavisolibacter sp.]